MRLADSFLCIIIAFAPALLWSQISPSRNFTTADGLSNNAVRSLFLDNKNTLWIGTENGISTLQGGHFTNLYKEDGIAQNSCWGICQDAIGNMWFASYGGGITKYDGSTYKVLTTFDGLAHNKTRKVFAHKDKVIVGTEYGVSVVDINSNAINTPKQVYPHFGVFIVTDIFEYNEEVYFSALNEGIFKIRDIESVPEVVRILTLTNSYGVGIFDSKIYSANKGFLNVLNFATAPASVTARFGESVAWQFARDKRDNVYASCWGIFDSSGGLFEIRGEKMIDVSEKFGIECSKLLNVVYDNSSDFLYVGSKEKGFYQVQLESPILYHPFNSKKVIAFEDHLILSEDGVDLSNGNELKNVTKENFKTFQKNYISKGAKADSRFELDFKLSASDIEFYSIVKRKKLYYINTNIGIFGISGTGSFVEYIPVHSYEFGFTTDDLFFESHPYGATTVYEDTESLHIKTFSDEVSSVVETLNIKGTTYFLSVFGGLSSFSNGKFKSYLKDGLFAEEKLKHAAKTSSGDLIVSSEFGDVFRITDLITFRNTIKVNKEKIIGNSISFLESYKDYIIIGTEKGINLYRNGVIQLIDEDQGLSDYRFTCSKIINEKLFVGTLQGYYTLNLAALVKKQSTISGLEISQILINNQPLASDDFKWFHYQNKSLQTTYDRNTISLDFVPIGSLYPNKLKYRYRLQKDNQWSPYTDKTNIFLPYLPYGNYNLEVEVLDLNSGIISKFAILELKILPPIYYRWWFLLASTLLILGLSYVVFRRWRIKSQEKELIQKRIAETKLEALLSQMNPHFMFNAMNAIQNYVISNDTINSLHYIGEFAKLMRKTLENSSKPTVSLNEEIDYLRTYISIENMRFNNKIEVEIKKSPNVITDLQIPTMLIQPFVENVFVHAFNSTSINPTITITFSMKDQNVLEIKICDNGKGVNMHSNSLHHSKGILFAKERLSLLQNSYEESIEIKSNFPSGTIVVVLLKV